MLSIDLWTAIETKINVGADFARLTVHSESDNSESNSWKYTQPEFDLFYDLFIFELHLFENVQTDFISDDLEKMDKIAFV